MRDTHQYDDIIDLPHHVSSKRAPMPLSDRAAQFAPFAALTGYEAVIRETGRLTQPRLELTEGEKLHLNDALLWLHSRIEEKPFARFLVFQPDGRKSGGAYVTLEGKVKKIDIFEQQIILENRTKIFMADLIAVETGNDSI